MLHLFEPLVKIKIKRSRNANMKKILLLSAADICFLVPDILFPADVLEEFCAPLLTAAAAGFC